MAEAKLDYQKLVSGLPQGVLGLGAQGEVVQMNPAAGRILGIDPLQAAGRIFSELFADRLEQGEEIFKTIASAQSKGTAISGLVIPLDKGGDESSHIALTVTPLAEGETAVVLTDVTRQEQMRRHHQKKHDQATNWALRLEQEKNRLEQALKKNLRFRLGAALVVVVIFAGLGYYTWNRTDLVSFVTKGLHGGAGKAVSESVYTVQPQPLNSSINLSGTIKPFETINLLSPFAGRVLKRHFEYGQKVNKGDLLLKLDTSDLEVKLREAEVAAIKADEEYKKLKDWKNSATVLQAERALNKAKNDLEVTQQKLHESKMLYKRGIIPLDEYRSLKEQVQNQKISLDTLKDQLRTAMEKGKSKNLLVAKLEKENAEAKLAKINKRIKRADMVAPVVGVVFKPTEDQAGKKGKTVEVGYQVEKGQVLLSLGNMERLSVSTTVGELNVAKLRKGQKVDITSYASPDLDLQGSIEAVSSQAIQSSSDSPPSFEVRVITKKLTPGQQAGLRLGMSANLQIKVVTKPKALCVPLGAVCPSSKGGSEVTLVDDKGGNKVVGVKTGMTTMDKVEITEGLKPGDKVVLPAKPKAN
ncbi:MAG: HlyD family efflux transporter periplasmic adaptor subunit [Deltaproteobacteria bacterium]|nr:HlyD family efflux transporter periplasmic adaptor subunit [Deltaproteobacteria bacterium]